MYYKALSQPNWTSADIDTAYHVNEKGAQWDASVGGTLCLHRAPPFGARVRDVYDARAVYDSIYADPFTNIVNSGSGALGRVSPHDEPSIR